MKIITIGREFGSGGRELGKRLADEMGIPCYDKEIIAAVAKERGLSPEHVEHITTSDIRRVYPVTIGRTLGSPIYYNNNAIDVLVSQQSVIKKLALEGDCIIVGRSADVILSEMHPMNLFVYADRESKLARCMARATGGETEKEMLKQMQRIDRDRASNRRMLSESEWGKRDTYHLCINTSGIEIKSIVPSLAAYINGWFEARKNG